MKNKKNLQNTFRPFASTMVVAFDLRSLLSHRGQNRLRRHRQRILPMTAM